MDKDIWVYCQDCLKLSLWVHGAGLDPADYIWQGCEGHTIVVAEKGLTRGE